MQIDKASSVSVGCAILGELQRPSLGLFCLVEKIRDDEVGILDSSVVNHLRDGCNCWLIDSVDSEI